jgi:hypothetical protein
LRGWLSIGALIVFIAIIAWRVTLFSLTIGLV